MKLNFKSFKRKLFGSSPGKKKKKRSSAISKKTEKIVSIILVVFMSMLLISLVGPTDIFDNDSGPKKTTTASTTVNPNNNSALGLRRFIAEPNITDGIETIDSEIVYNVDFTIENFLYDEENNVYISGVGKQIAIEGTGTNEMLMATLSLVFSEVTMSMGEETETATDMGLPFALQGIKTGDKSFQWASDGIPTINVISCDETAKAWLLANTEPVTKSEDDSVVGAWKFNDVLDFSSLGLAPRDKEGHSYYLFNSFTEPVHNGYLFSSSGEKRYFGTIECSSYYYSGETEKRYSITIYYTTSEGNETFSYSYPYYLYNEWKSGPITIYITSDEGINDKTFEWLKANAVKISDSTSSAALIDTQFVADKFFSKSIVKMLRNVATEETFLKMAA